MTTISFNEFSKGGPVSVVGNEGNVLKQEAESGPSFMQGLSRVASIYGKNLKEQALGGVETAQKTLGMGVDTMQQAQQIPLDTKQQRQQAFGKATAGALQTGVGAMSGVIQTAFSPLTALIQTGVQGLSELDQATGGKIQNQLATLAQSHPELIKGYSDMVTQNPKTAQFVADSINVLTAGLGGKPALEAAQGATKGLVTGTKEAITSIPKPSVPSAVSGVAEKMLPTSESIMQRVARIPKGEQAKFEKLTGKSVGQFLDETGNYGTPDKIVEKLYNDFTQSKANADEALAQIQGTYKSEPVTTALKELEGKVQRTSSPGAPDADLARVTELLNKEKSQGLTMTEINEVKRIYERRVRLDYLKSNVPEDVTRANNVDNALRNWQFKEAEKAGLTNLPEINKFTQANKQLMDALGKEISGSAGNNALGLTDAILVAGGSPESIASLITKKVFSDKGVQSYIAKKISKTPVKTEAPKANFKTSKPSTQSAQEKVLQPSPNTTPSTPKGKGIRGMINFSEWIPKNEGKTLKKANGDSVVFTGKTEMIDGELKYELKDADGSDYVSAKILERIASEQPTIDITIAENKKSLDTYNKEKQTQLIREQTLKDKAIERKAQSMELGDFTESMTPMQKAKVAAALDKNIRLSTGEVITKREYIKRKIDSGYEVSDTGIIREKGKDAGYALNKTEADYARFLSKKKVSNETYDATEVSSKLKNSLLSNPTGKYDKPDRFVGEQYSIKEASTGLAENGKNLNGRIVIGKDDKGNLIIKDGTHLLEAYRILKKDIPSDKIAFENGVTAKDLSSPKK